MRDSYLTAIVNHGNLVLFGANQWGTHPHRQPADRGRRAGADGSREPHAATTASGEPPPAAASRTSSLSAGALESLAGADAGYDYRLVWVLSPRFEGDLGTWEALVDAHSGELLSLQDTNQYQSVRRVQGGVLPVSNDGVPPDGVEQPGWPFPFADVTTAGGSYFTDIGGNLPVCATGSISSTLNGRFVRMADVCGPINLASAGQPRLRRQRRHRLHHAGRGRRRQHPRLRAPASTSSKPDQGAGAGPAARTTPGSTSSSPPT